MKLLQMFNLKNTKAQSPIAGMAQANYEHLYESVAQTLPPDISIGGGDFDLVGKMTLDRLIGFGLLPKHTLFDFGCGTGRLAKFATSYLDEGNFFGSDISKTMLLHCEKLLNSQNKKFTLYHQTEYTFPERTDGYDMFSAFSVFTHMEHEDVYNYLLAARRQSHKNTKFVASILDINKGFGRMVFLNSAALLPYDRWNQVKNVVTSIELFTEISKLSGWKIIEWLPADDGDGAQSVAVMEQL